MSFARALWKSFCRRREWFIMSKVEYNVWFYFVVELSSCTTMRAAIRERGPVGQLVVYACRSQREISHLRCGIVYFPYHCPLHSRVFSPAAHGAQRRLIVVQR